MMLITIAAVEINVIREDLSANEFIKKIPLWIFCPDKCSTRPSPTNLAEMTLSSHENSQYHGSYYNNDYLRVDTISAILSAISGAFAYLR